MDYILEDNGNGKTVPKKVGLAPIMRDGISYEFTTVFDVALNHECETSKDRSQLFTDKIFKITEDTGRTISDWLKTAKEKPPEPTQGELEETERQQRITGRTNAALSAMPAGSDGDNWLSAYCEDASALVGRPVKNKTHTMSDFTIAELKLMTPRHEEIVKLTTARAK